MIRPLIRRAAVTATALLSALTLSVTQAGAASIAYNTATLWLKGDPTSDTDPACVTREIYLASGNYGWGQTHGGRPGAGRTIWLQAGTYGMRDCLFGGLGDYAHSSLLVPELDLESVELRSTWDPGSDGTYTWGSYLNPYF
ncbi:hypothetical protein ABTX77_23730 [Streptomyces sp. NPDC097704]|uniref:hypothetical protein n=1 Tax=Streptomyces sp. NPDC097704 TaxID=3157101 RepID=UPI003327D0B2